MSRAEIALQLTIKALETGYIPRRDWSTFDGEDPTKAATDYLASQVSDFYKTIYDRLGEM